jgi:hypothetical protein
MTLSMRIEFSLISERASPTYDLFTRSLLLNISRAGGA